MGSIYSGNLKISIFGQSHSEAIGVVIDGLPAGKKIDREAIEAFMEKRAPGRNSVSTQRREADKPVFLSGVVDGYTCGAPLCAVIYNGDAHSKDYSEIADKPRPGHADFTADVKYKSYQDVRGGGHFSGRLTAPMCIAGAICLGLLKEEGIEIGAHILSVKDIFDDGFDPLNVGEKEFSVLEKADFPVLNKEKGEMMKTFIEGVSKELDSVGGIIECAATGLPIGLGDPMFDGLENRISRIAFGIPAVKGIEFGEGFGATKLYGSENNDPYFYGEDGKIRTGSNRHGGILGGISSGMPLIFRCAFKPTPSIYKEQNTVSLSKKENATLQIKGRHDPCIVPRAVPVVASAAAIAIYDAYLEYGRDK